MCGRAADEIKLLREKVEILEAEIRVIKRLSAEIDRIANSE
jgi:hypothetical protein